MKVYISPSTQKANVGAGIYGTEEKRMNEIADLLCPMLDFNGIPWVRNKPTMALSQVVADSNIQGVDLHVAIHSNALAFENAGKARGCEVLYYTGSVKGKAISQAIYNNLSPLTPSIDRGLKESVTLMELNSTKSPSCIIEIAFHDNLQDAEWILANKPVIAEAICKGICEYYGVTYKSNTIDYKAKYEALVAKLKMLIES